MRHNPVFPCFCLLLALATGATAQEKTAAPVPLVQQGRSACVVVIPQQAPPSVQKLARDFVDIVQRSTGAGLTICTDDQSAPIDAAATRLFLGACRQVPESALAASPLADEEYRIVVRDRSVFILGKPAMPLLRPGSKLDPWHASDPLRWAVNRLLEEGLGVRWLWPGRLGTYVPKHADFFIPAQDVTYQPRLKMRIPVIATMRSPQERQIRTEAFEWAANHQAGERDGIPLNHGFTLWWEKYHQTHPDYFAQPPEGFTVREPGRAKLSLANPAVLDQIAAEYVEAGRPPYWNVTPNDGVGFDVSQAVRAWDDPPNQPIRDIWTGNAELTARYVKWWNMIHQRLAAINPDVKLVTMAYSCYRQPPTPGHNLTAKAVIGIVPSYRAYDVWTGWAKQSDELILRPNWGHYGANGPHLPLQEITDYMQFASKNKMIGFYLDSILGFWANQGLNYYLMARLMTRPELSADDIVQEYVAAFGKGEPKIRDYFQYWRQITTEYAHGHKVYKVPEGKYDALIREGKIVDNPYIGPLQALPHIYTDDMLAKAYALLDEADQLIGDSDPEARQRVNFLRSGLNELRLARDCIALGTQVEKSPTPALIKQFQQKADALEVLRTELTPSHAIWGGFTTRREDKFKIKIRPRNMTLPKWNGDDDF